MQKRRSLESGSQSEVEDVSRRKVASRSFIEAGWSIYARADYVAKELGRSRSLVLQTVYDLPAKSRVGLRFNCKNLASKCASLRFTCNRQFKYSATPAKIYEAMVAKVFQPVFCHTPC
jgi:hypothetical protein